MSERYRIKAGTWLARRTRGGPKEVSERELRRMGYANMARLVAIGVLERVSGKGDANPQMAQMAQMETGEGRPDCEAGAGPTPEAGPAPAEMTGTDAAEYAAGGDDGEGEESADSADGADGPITQGTLVDDAGESNESKSRKAKGKGKK